MATSRRLGYRRIRINKGIEDEIRPRPRPRTGLSTGTTPNLNDTDLDYLRQLRGGDSFDCRQDFRTRLRTAFRRRNRFGGCCLGSILVCLCMCVIARKRPRSSSRPRGKHATVVFFIQCVCGFRVNFGRAWLYTYTEQDIIPYLRCTHPVRQTGRCKLSWV